MFKTATTAINLLRIGEVLGHHINAEISPKAASEKAQTTLSENRYTSLKIDVFRMAILLLLVSTGNNAQTSFLVQQAPLPSVQSCNIAKFVCSFPSMFECLNIPCRPIIVNLLYMYASSTLKSYYF